MARGGNDKRSNLVAFDDMLLPINTSTDELPDWVVIERSHYDALTAGSSRTTLVEINPDEDYNAATLERMDRDSYLEDFVRPGMTTPCRVSLNSRNAGGYTGTSYKAADGINRRMYSHRLRWLLTRGYLTPDRVVMHLCDNPVCHAEDHVLEGTTQENIQAAADQGKMGRNADQTGKIQQMMLAGRTNREIAERFDMLNSTITNLRAKWRKEGILPAHQSAYDRLTDEQKADILAATEAGMSMNQLLRAFDTTRTAIERVQSGA